MTCKPLALLALVTVLTFAPAPPAHAHELPAHRTVHLEVSGDELVVLVTWVSAPGQMTDLMAARTFTLHPALGKKLLRLVSVHKALAPLRIAAQGKPLYVGPTGNALSLRSKLVADPGHPGVPAVAVLLTLSLPEKATADDITVTAGNESTITRVAK